MGEIFPLCKVLILLVINFMKRFSNGSLFTVNWSSRHVFLAIGSVYLWWVQYSVFEFAHEWCDYNLHVSVAFN